MMNKLKAKLKNQGGFTLVEMLIVVAIVAILIAISIPMVNDTLEKARHATDDANFRAAAGLADIKYLSEGEDAVGTYYYTVTDTSSQGALVEAANAAAATGALQAKCTETTGTRTDGSKSFKDAYLKVSIAAKGVVTVEWVAS